MGASWSPKPEILDDHKLVTKGLFGYCRHPMYTGFFYHTIVIALLTFNWVVYLTFLVIVIVVCSHRIPNEERMMITLFGEEYK